MLRLFMVHPSKAKTGQLSLLQNNIHEGIPTQTKELPAPFCDFCRPNVSNPQRDIWVKIAVRVKLGFIVVGQNSKQPMVDVDHARKARLWFRVGTITYMVAIAIDGSLPNSRHWQLPCSCLPHSCGRLEEGGRWLQTGDLPSPQSSRNRYVQVLSKYD